ncbi:MAG: histidine triad (HIT) family protein [Marinoscillum sp.]|jgi:histidine triad (HIT) family protein
MPTIFSKIISRDIPAHIVAENDDYLAFLDISPLVEGHTLVIPKKEVDYIFDLDDETLSGLHLFAKRVALAIQSVLPCERIGLTVMGTEVPHAHIHLIPMNTMDDMNFSRMKLSFEQKEFEATAKLISKAFKSIN